MHAKNVLAGLLSLSLLVPVTSRGQASSKLEFEVASVRPAQGPPPSQVICEDPCLVPSPTVSGQLTYRYTNLMLLLTGAFQTTGDQIDGPSWLVTEKYDIVAKVPGETPRIQTWEMMKNLLIDRFHMEYHTTQQEFEVYNLTVAKGGAKLKEAAPPVGPKPVHIPGVRIPEDDEGFPILPPGYHNLLIAGHYGVFHLSTRVTTINDLVLSFKGLLRNQHLFDKTGLTGTYDVKLKFDYTQLPGAFGLIDPAQPSDPALNLFKALEQQLGLKLEKSKAPLDVVVIDHIDKTPTEN